MSKFIIEFSTDNAAFYDCDGVQRDSAETVRILRDVADSIETGANHGPIRDSNGNKIGQYAHHAE